MHQNEIAMVATMLLATVMFLRPNLPQLVIQWAGEALKPDKPDKQEPPAWEITVMHKKDSGGGSAPKPDPAIGKAAEKQAQIAEDWLNFSREQYGVANARQERQDAIANKLTQQQMDTSQQAADWAAQDRARYQQQFVPLQNQFIEKAQNWDSEERQNKLASEARADVLTNANAQREATNRQLTSMGVDPTSGRYAAINRNADLNTSLAAAGAENNARNTVRKEAVGMLGDAINLGSGLAVNPASSLGLSTNAGNSAFSMTANNNQQAAGLGSIMTSGYQGASNGYNSQAQILNQQYQNQLSAWQTQQQASQNSTSSLASGLGSLAGMGMMMFSSKDYKENKRPAEGALDAVNSMPVEHWKYKDGIADGAEHIGPYAEDFQKATGKGDGKTIPIVDGIGLTMKAVQELSKKVDNLASGYGMPMSAAA